MAKEIEKISVNQFESALDKEEVITETLIDTEDVTITIRKTLSLHEMLDFVQEIVESCVDGETGEYIPEAYDFAVRVGVLTRYANFTMPANMEKKYWLVYNTRAFQQVLNHINEYQFNDIIRTVDKKIKFMLDVISSSAVGKLNEVINKFGEIADISSKVFGGNNADDIANIVKNMAKVKDMSEEDLAKIIINKADNEEK